MIVTMSKIIAIIILSFGLMGCGKTVIDTSCTAFKPIRYSASNDTPETVQEVREHNAAWTAICK